MDPSPDFDRLAIGTRFASRGRTVTEADVAAFASLTGDMHPQHTDAVWAARSPFGARIAHGMLVLSYAMGLLSLDPERLIFAPFTSAEKRSCLGQIKKIVYTIEAVYPRPIDRPIPARARRGRHRLHAVADVSAARDGTALVPFNAI